MPCYVQEHEDGLRFYCIRGTAKAPPHCSDCLDMGLNLCDFPVGKGKTCDRRMCEKHSHEIAPNVHYCDAHYKMWQGFRDSGGVKKELEHVVPFISKR